MSWTTEHLVSLAPEGISVNKLISRLAKLSLEDRAAAAKVLGKALPLLRRQQGADFPIVLITAVCNPTPAQFASELTELGMFQLQAAHPWRFLTTTLAAYGPEWTKEMVQRAATRRDADELVPLLDDLIVAHDLPLPTAPRFWSGWVAANHVPVPGRRWWEHAIAACSAPDALSAAWTADPEMAAGLAQLRTVEPTDDEAMAAALITVFGRGDRPRSQQVALRWLRTFELEEQVWKYRKELIAALPTADPSVVKYAVGQCLRPELEPGLLDAMAAAVLVGKQQGVKSTILKALSMVSAPSAELQAAVAALTQGRDPKLAATASALAQTWNQPVTADTTAEGLWRTPAGLQVQAVTMTQTLDAPDFAAMVSRLDADNDHSSWFHEAGLAAVVAYAWQHGKDSLVSALDGRLQHTTEPSVLKQQLRHWLHREQTGEQRPDQHHSPLTQFAVQRCVEALEALGQVPCLLSTPSHEGNRIDWQVLMARLEQYQQLQLPVLPCDLIVALARIEDSNDAAIPELQVVGTDSRLPQLIAQWRAGVAEPGQLTITQHLAHGQPGSLQPHFTVTGDVCVVAAELGLGGAWIQPYREAGVLWADEPPATLGLLPAHISRPAGYALGPRRHAATGSVSSNFLTIAPMAHRFDQVLSLTALVAAADATPRQRELVADALLDAWDTRRLDAEALLIAWQSPHRELLKVTGLQLIPVLILIAEAGGLALVWPLLVEIAEELAVMDRLPATTGSVLTAVAGFIPDVLAADAPVKFPAVTALAQRKGGSKALVAARRIVDLIR